ncbi:hypothetical protein ARAM_004545 [Aspergillus rambellii]|uniref:FAD-binding FR-type domain-containing protein n=1 Tax=Aspergillus rambellii TaxID=308745 RepID=A0A0F8U8E9_9EURO|nr:hypothetical protein ARAM_004545 [Aspergillus rambellii]
MSTYEVEHNTSDPSNTQQFSRRRRPDLSTFFATLSEISSDESRSRPYAVPVPRDISAAFYSLAEALNIMRREGGGTSTSNGDELPTTLNPDGTPIEVHGDDLLAQMIQTLLSEAETPPKEVEGVSEEFCDVLDRVPRSSLKPSQTCPICSNPFLEDEYPLVVRLPCHPTHVFDLECVRPWLRLRGTCPLDRTDLAKQEREKAAARRKKPVEDEEDEWDGLMMKQSPLLAIGALDKEGRPWSSVWGGEEGFATPTSMSSFDVRTPVGETYDPVVESLLLDPAHNSGKLVSFLAIDLENRQRVKLYGKLTAGSLDILGEDEHIQAGIAHLAVHVDGSLGNCPKYLNAKHILPAPPDPKLISENAQLPSEAIRLLHRADCLFISSSHGNEDMDTNIRGGPPGFVRVISNEPSGAVFVYPEYSGNRLYQTLGNLQTNPLAGYVFPDFETGNALFVTGKAEILIGKDAASVLPHSNLAVRVTTTASRFVEKALTFRGIPGKPSPYNPGVRYLATEKVCPATLSDVESPVTATLIRKEIITPSIGRFRFRISDPKLAGSWTPGQYATFSFQDELDMGYSHMNDSDPSSLNDDYVRTFTVSSCPGYEIPDGEFEITARKHGNVTRYLFRANDRAGLEVPLKGFGGDFRLMEQSSDDILFPFIAGGIGITPVLAQLPIIDISRLRLLWSVSIKDIDLVLDTFKRFPQLPSSTTIFATGGESPKEQRSLEAAISSGAQIYRRRMEAKDVDLSLAERWYFVGAHL